MRVRICLPIFLIILGACSTSKITLVTSPSGAEITSKPIGSGAQKKLGNTPLTISTNELSESTGGTGPLRIQLKKEGYIDRDILLPEMGAQDLRIQIDLAPRSILEDPIFLNRNIEKLFTAQALIQRKKLAEAKKLLEEVQKSIPQLSASYEMTGGINFLSGDRNQALYNLKKALELNPDSLEALSIIRKIQHDPAFKSATGPNGGEN